jgi:hypothetical protein
LGASDEVRLGRARASSTDKEKEERMKLQRFREDDRGLSTAELLGNAALAIAALVAIWALLQQLGVDIVGWIRTAVLG